MLGNKYCAPICITGPTPGIIPPATMLADDKKPTVLILVLSSVISSPPKNCPF